MKIAAAPRRDEAATGWAGASQLKIPSTMPIAILDFRED
jgi:hypothetical protein